MPLSYQKYLALDQLLHIQHPRSTGPEHDEMLFIIIHQTYELWFKQMLHDLAYIQQSLLKKNQSDIFHGFKRLLSILKVLVKQTDILETMTPVAFSSFRERLDTASGFQSVQFREFEIILGKRGKSLLSRFDKDSEDYLRLNQLMHKPSLWDSFLLFLQSQGYKIPTAILNRDLSESTRTSTDVQNALLHIYQQRGSLMEMCERLVDLDEGLQEWRYRHVKMVERTIGMKRGTGGSSGVEYLKNSVFQPLFPDLWEIRVSL